jgi:hypothetical protein
MILTVDPINRTIHIDQPVSLNELLDSVDALDMGGFEDEEGNMEFLDWTLVPTYRMVMSLS